MSKKLLIVLLVVVMAIPAMGSLTTAGAQDVTYNEAPALAEKVAAGELPPVAERLPENPRVVPLSEGDTIGVYGGVWHRGWRGVSDYTATGV